MKENSIIFGNLPYNISSQILVKIINFKKKPPKYQSLILMFQKEVAEENHRILWYKKLWKAINFGKL